jgi:hypothetical protein
MAKLSFSRCHKIRTLGGVDKPVVHYALLTGFDETEPAGFILLLQQMPDDNVKQRSRYHTQFNIANQREQANLPHHRSDKHLQVLKRKKLE